MTAHTRRTHLPVVLAAGLLATGFACASSEETSQESSQEDSGPQPVLDSMNHLEGEKGSARATREFQLRRSTIEAEFETADAAHAFAGEYYQGDGLGENVSLLLGPGGDFTFQWHGCLGLYDQNFGRAVYEDGRLELTCEFENDRKGFQGIDTTLIRVPWGERTYLIPPDEMITFCNWINSNHEPRQGLHGPFLLRAGDHEKPVTGLPELPEEYRHAILAEPLAALLVEVDEPTLRDPEDYYHNRRTEAVIDLGRKAGVFKGMKLYILEERVRGMVNVIEVGEDSARVSIRQKDDQAAPTVGWKLATRR